MSNNVPPPEKDLTKILIKSSKFINKEIETIPNKTITIELIKFSNIDKDFNEIISNMDISYCLKTKIISNDEVLDWDIERSVIPYFWYFAFNDKENPTIKYENNKCSFSLFPLGKTTWFLEVYNSAKENKDCSLELEYRISLQEYLLNKSEDNDLQFRITFN
jgi:hypothetical protein